MLVAVNGDRKAGYLMLGRQGKAVEVRKGDQHLGRFMLMENLNPPQVFIINYYESLKPYLPLDYQDVHPTMEKAVEYLRSLFPGWTFEAISEDTFFIHTI
jgi:hypothetical protein